MADETPHPDDFDIPTGDELREMRQSIGITQVAMARLTDVSQAAISHWESGCNMPSAGKLGEYLDVLAVATELADEFHDEMDTDEEPTQGEQETLDAVAETTQTQTAFETVPHNDG